MSSHAVAAIGNQSTNRRQRASSGPCIACGGRDREVRYSRRLAWLQQCALCGFQFAEPQPSDEELREIYRSDYYAAFGCRGRVVDSYHQLMCSRAERLLAEAEQTFSVGRLLDVGSGLGNLLSTGRQRGWDVKGVELNSYAVDHVDERLPGATFCGGIEEFDGEPERFGLITCLDVIEHLRRPDHVLNDLQALLQPGGGLVISTVDAGSLSARLMGSRWPHYHRDHLWYFDRESLITIVERAGLTVLHCRRARKVFTLHYLMSILSQSGQAPLLRAVAGFGLRLLPAWVSTRQFSLPEGLFLVAQRTEP